MGLGFEGLSCCDLYGGAATLAVFGTVALEWYYRASQAETNVTHELACLDAPPQDIQPAGVDGLFATTARPTCAYWLLSKPP